MYVMMELSELGFEIKFLLQLGATGKFCKLVELVRTIFRGELS